MTSPGELAVRERHALTTDIDPAHLTGAQLKFIANTDFVPKAFRGNVPAIAACVATGRAVGIPDMTALRSIHIIDGKASFSAELMVMLVRKAGHSIVGQVTAEQAAVTGTRSDTGDQMTATFTIDDAKRAGLVAKDNWKWYPESMLWARAVSQLCRMLFADCFAGATYTPEELGAGDFTADELMDEPVPATAEDEVEDGDFAPVDDEVPVTGPSDEQRSRLLELFSQLNDAKPDTDWGKTLTGKLKRDWNAKSYNDLTGPQMGELVAFLEEQLAA